MEICRSYIVEDLYAAKHFLRIFPKEHQLYNNFIIFYHNGIINKVFIQNLLTFPSFLSNKNLQFFFFFFHQKLNLIGFLNNINFDKSNDQMIVVCREVWFYSDPN